MRGNICPVCGKSVMSYKRFFREAEPYKISKCDSCAVNLKRSRKVYLYLVLMIIPLCLIVAPVFVILLKAQASFWIIVPLLILILAGWTVVTNYLAWRLIGWELVIEEKK